MRRYRAMQEDCIFAGARHPDNVLPITHWTGDPTDRALASVGPLLCSLLAADGPDVRPRLRQHFGLSARMAQMGGSLGCPALLTGSKLDVSLLLTRDESDGSDSADGGPTYVPLDVPPQAPGCPLGCTCRFATEHAYARPSDHRTLPRALPRPETLPSRLSIHTCSAPSLCTRHRCLVATHERLTRRRRDVQQCAEHEDGTVSRATSPPAADAMKHDPSTQPSYKRPRKAVGSSVAGASISVPAPASVSSVTNDAAATAKVDLED
jgi:hypothetical protein